MLAGCAEVLHRLSGLKQEMAIFLSDSNNNDTHLRYKEDFIQKLAYLVDIFES
jgi:hypothetical protein